MHTEVKTARVGELEVAYQSLGEGPPLLLIMGSGSTMDLWPPVVLERLSSRFQVIVFDHRGMGLTSSPPGPFTIEQLADDAAGLLAALGLQSARVLGWSMGAYVAQELALRHPARVDALVLYAGSCGGAQAVPPTAEVLRDLTDTAGTARERGQRLFNLLFPESWLRSHPDFYRQFPVPRERSAPESIAKQGGACESWAGTYERLPGLRQPTLILAGTEDRVVPPANALVLAERIPGSWLVRLGGAGHGVMYQLPEKVSRVVLDFLEP